MSIFWNVACYEVQGDTVCTEGCATPDEVQSERATAVLRGDYDVITFVCNGAKCSRCDRKWKGDLLTGGWKKP
jgi:hypothetical protein